MRSSKYSLVSAALVLLLSACAGGKPINTDWATPGTTTRTTIKERFGEPAEYYENGKILAYRLVRRQGSFGSFTEEFTLAIPGEARSNLIFTFDGEGILTNVSRVELKD